MAMGEKWYRKKIAMLERMRNHDEEVIRRLKKDMDKKGERIDYFKKRLGKV